MAAKIDFDRVNRIIRERDSAPQHVPAPQKPQSERLDSKLYTVDDVSKHYGWEGFDHHELNGLHPEPRHALFTREHVPVSSLRLANGPTPSYHELASQGEHEQERLHEVERGHEQGALPPIVVARHGDHHVIADGAHRAAVAAHRGNSHIEAFVTDPNADEDEDDEHHHFGCRHIPPDAGTLLRTAARDKDFGWHVTAAWRDVQAKAKRIRSEGGVTIVVASNDGIGGQVTGDHGTYEALLVYAPGTRKVADWTCFLPDAPVTMADGSEKPISEIEVGDLVLSHLGNARQVVRTEPKPYEGGLTTLVFRGDRRAITATSEHEVWTPQGWRAIGELKPGDYVSSATPQGELPVLVTVPRPARRPVSEGKTRGVQRYRREGYEKWQFRATEGGRKGGKHVRYFDTEAQAIQYSNEYYAERDSIEVKIDVELASVLGWYAAEGFVRSSGVGYMVGFSLSVEERDVAEHIDDIVWRYFGTRGSIRQIDNKLDYRVSDWRLHYLCTHLVGSGAHEKRLHADLMMMPLEEQRAFVAAWLAGDGHVDPRNGRARISSVSETLIRQGRDLLARLGEVPSIGWRDDNRGSLPTTQNAGRIYTLSWVPGSETRRWQRRGGDRIWREIISVSTEQYSGEVWDIEVEEDHSFRAYGIDVHNCGCKWAAYAFERSPGFRHFAGRKCSHALALQFEAQAQGMFGKEIHPSEPPEKVRTIVRYDPDSGQNIYARPYEGSLASALVARMRADDEDPAVIIGGLVGAGLRHAAALRMFKEAIHPPHHEEHDDQHHCPHCGGFIGAVAYEHHRCPHCGAPLGGEHHHGAVDGATFTHNALAEGSDDASLPDLGMVDAPELGALHTAGRTWYHGTPAENVADIREHGVRPSAHDWDLRLTDSKPQASVYAGSGGKVLEYHVPDDHPAIGPSHEHNMFGQNANAVSLREPLSSAYLVNEHNAAKSDRPGPTVSGLALKAHDTGRVLMLQRGLDDPDDPAAGTWEFPGGHHEEGDLTSLHAAIREWQEEVGQELPASGVVKHTWTSPNGIYQGHVLVIPSEKDLAMHNGRVVPNPDDPKGDHHEQAAWWDPEHARKIPALRQECKDHTPWKEIAKASLDHEKTAAAWDPISNPNPQPGRATSEPAHSNSTNPASTGYATSEDPANWDNLDADPTPLTPSLSYDSVLHSEPEPALPVTYGEESERPAEISHGDLDPVPDNPSTPAHLVPDQDSTISLLQGGSMMPSYHYSSAEPESVRVASIVQQFQQSEAAQALMTPKDEGGDDIAAAAKAHLAKTALKEFDFHEQQELINEGNDGRRARNFGDLRIEGTHYELLAAALDTEEADSTGLFI